MAADTTFTLQQQLGYLRQHGSHCQAFATLQPGLRYFHLPDVGYISYASLWGFEYVLADPICAQADLGLILAAFHRRFPRATYVQVSRPVMEILHRRFGFYGTQIGIESRIALDDWSRGGKKKQIIRTAVNQAKAAGIRFDEQHNHVEIEHISRAWLHTRRTHRREIMFLIRPMQMDHQPDVRHFYAFQEEQVIGFVFFDPIYRDNRIIGYVPNISRASKSFRQGLFYALMAHAIEVFKAEGVPYLDLGLSPLARRADAETQESTSLRWLIKQLKSHGTSLFNWTGLAFTKSRFEGEQQTIYCCHKSALPLMTLLSLLRLTRLI